MYPKTEFPSQLMLHKSAEQNQIYAMNVPPKSIWLKMKSILQCTDVDRL